MKKILTLTAIAASLVSGTSMAITPTDQNFNDTGDILARSKRHTNIEYDIMVQRATQAAIYYMPAVAQVDFIGTVVEYFTAECEVSDGQHSHFPQIPDSIFQVNGGGGEEQSDRAAVIEKFGVPPESIADYLALVGDSADFREHAVCKLTQGCCRHWVSTGGHSASAIRQLTGVVQVW